jgi:hypothetical protein
VSEPEEPGADAPDGSAKDAADGAGRPVEPEPWTGALGALRPPGPDPTARGPRPKAAEIDPLGAELDPEAAILDRETYQRPLRLPPPVIDTRKYQRMIGGFGLLLVVAFSIYLYARGGNGTPGVAPGQRLHNFVAPLATSDLTDIDANGHPVCNRARPSRRGLNVCGRRPIVLTFFTSGYKACVQQVDTLQSLAARFPKVQFAAVGLGVSHNTAAKLVRENHWTIQVAYDKSDVVGQIYGVEVCPLVEVARIGGVVEQRLIGKYWLSATHLAAAVRKLES